MSEQQAEPTSGESGSVEPVTLHASDASVEPANIPAEHNISSEPHTSETMASLEPQVRTEAPDLVPDQGAAGEAPELKAPEIKASDLQTTEIKATEASAPRAPGKLMIMSPGDRAWGDRSWAHEEAAPETKTEASQNPGLFGKRRFAAMAAVVALAMVAGALGGALATASFGHVAGETTASTSGNQAFEATVARIDADIVALKASVDHTSKTGISQFNKTSDRLDKLEKAQAEPAAKLAKLSEAVEKLHATPPAVAPAAPVAQKEVTGSVAPQVAAAAPAPTPVSAAPAAAAAPKVEVARLPTLEDWILRDVGHGGALIEGRQGIYEVYAGDPVPGLGRVDAIRRQDGHWVVVTSRGLIVAR